MYIDNRFPILYVLYSHYLYISIYGFVRAYTTGLCGSVRMDLKGTGVKLGTVNPGGVATPWWSEPDRGGKAAPATQEKLDSLLTPEDVAQATMSLIDQSSTSNIEMISLDPPE